MDQERSYHVPADREESLVVLRDQTREQLLHAQDEYVTEKQKGRSFLKNSSLFQFLQQKFNRGHNHHHAPEDTLLHTREAYEKQRNRFIGLEARIATDSRTTEATPDQEYQQTLAENVGRLVVEQERALTQVEVKRQNKNAAQRVWNLVRRHPVARTVIGLGLNLSIGVSAATGQLPFTMALVGARVAFGAAGIEGAIQAVSNKFDKKFKGVPMARPSGLSMEEIRNRIAAFSELRITQGDEKEKKAEKSLLEEYRRHITEKVHTLFEQAPETYAGEGGGIKNWKRGHAQAEAVTLAIEQLTQEQASIQEELPQKQAELEQLAGEKVEKTTRKTAIETEKTTKTTQQQEATQKRDQATHAIETYTNILSSDTSRGGLLAPTATLAVVTAACQRYFDAQARLEQLRSQTPRPDALITHEQQIQTTVKTELATNAIATDKVESILSAFKERLGAEEQKTNQELLRAETEQAVRELTEEENQITAELVALDEHIAPLQEEVTRLEERAALIETEELPAQKEQLKRHMALSKDQALLVYELLLGGSGRRANTATPEVLGIGPQPGLLKEEQGYKAKEEAMVEERKKRGRRWAAALIASGIVTLATLPPTEVIRFVPPDPLYSEPGIGIPNVSSLLGQAEAKYMQTMGLDPLNRTHEEVFRRLVAQDPQTHGERLMRYCNWVRVNNPDAFFVDQKGIVHPDLIKHNVDIVAPSDLRNFFLHAPTPYNGFNKIPGIPNPNISLPKVSLPPLTIPNLPKRIV